LLIHSSLVTIPGKKREPRRLYRAAAASSDNRGSYLVQIRITAQPDPDLFDGYDVRHYRVGEIFELPVHVATLLLMANCAEETGGTTQAFAEAADSPGSTARRKS